MLLIYTLSALTVIYFVLCILSPKKVKYLFTTVVYTHHDNIFSSIAKLSQHRSWNPWIISNPNSTITEGGESELPGAFIEWKDNTTENRGRITNIKTDKNHILQRMELAESRIRVIVLEHYLEEDQNPNITHWTWKYVEMIPFFRSPIVLVRQMLRTTEEMDLQKTMLMVKNSLEQ